MTARYDRHGDTVAHTLSGQLDYVTLIERCRVQAVLPAPGSMTGLTGQHTWSGRGPRNARGSWPRNAR